VAVNERPQDKPRLRFCGVDCLKCATYQGYLAGETKGLVNPETQYRCCWLPRDYPEGRDCTIRLCCEGRGLVLCGECSQFEVCPTLREFYAQPGYEALRQRMKQKVAAKASRERDAAGQS
jgi:hypothetical protein